MTADSFVWVEHFVFPSVRASAGARIEEDALVGALTLITIPADHDADLRGCTREDIAKDFEMQMREVLHILRSTT